MAPCPVVPRGVLIPDETGPALLLDTFSLLFRAYHALPRMNASDGQPTNALYGFTSLVLLSAKVLESAGWDAQSYPIGNIAPGIQIHLQAAVLESPVTPPPLAVTNATSGTVGP